MVVLILSGSVGMAHSASAQNQSGDQGTGCCVATDSLMQWLSPLYRGWLT